MDFDEYQREARSTAIYPGLGKEASAYPILGLCGEAGEVAEKVKKIIRDESGQVTMARRLELAKELGDVLWYLANIAEDLGLLLSFVADQNIQKLRSRKKRAVLQGSGDNR